MAVSIRLTRMGKKGQPFYRIVAMDSKSSRDGKYIEQIGTYEPLKGGTKINVELALKWLKVGSKPTETVKKLFTDEKILQKFHESKTTTTSTPKPIKSKSTKK